MVLEKNWITTYRRIQLDPFLVPLTKFNSKWTEGLNIRPKAVKLLEDSIKNKFLNIVLANIFQI